ncbi:MAG: hypothetical protein F4Z74_01280 [Acidobacteria bacterium]|nr:hypothetical protein [Acidobacteriota bacterium]MYE44591.1 hypothetical protein [Acidobacteriota bacterium]
MTTLIVPYRCDGGADRVGSTLGFRQTGSEWIGDCPACEGSEALALRPSGEDRPGQFVCVCRGACEEATGLRAVLIRILGPEAAPQPPRNTKVLDDMNFGGALARKRA